MKYLLLPSRGSLRYVLLTLLDFFKYELKFYLGENSKAVVNFNNSGHRLANAIECVNFDQFVFGDPISHLLVALAHRQDERQECAFSLVAEVTWLCTRLIWQLVMMVKFVRMTMLTFTSTYCHI